MKKMILCGLWVVGLLIGWTAQAGSYFQDRAGLIFRGSYWNMRGDDHIVHVSSKNFFNNSVDVGGFGGWITFFSGAGERGQLEFSLGGIAHVNVLEKGFYDEEVHVTAVTPIVAGYQYSFFTGRNPNAFQPYLSVGGGPYVQSKVHTIEYSLFDEETTVKNKIMPGLYSGLGTYFILTEWLAFQGEMRYHLINFDPDDNCSGLELSVGLAVTWKRR